MLSGIKKLFQKEEEPLIHTDAPHIVKWRCTRGRFEGSSCIICKESCVKNAVVIDKIPYIDNALCDRCGICEKNCPNEAINLPLPTLDATFFMKEKAIFRCVKKRKKDDLKLDGVIDVPCICSVKPYHLLEAVSEGVSAVYLYEGYCSGCEYGIFIDGLKDEVEFVNKLLTVLNYGKRIFFFKSTENILKDKDVNINERFNCSRRDFFFRFGAESFKLVTAGSKDEKSNKGLKSYELSESRKRLINSVKKLLADKTGYDDLRIESYFYSIRIGENCDFCGNCTSFCPTGALFTRGDNREKRIHFVASDCTGCNLCADICSKEAVSLNRESFKLSDILNRSSLEVIKKEKKACEKCGRGFLPGEDEELCLYCIKEKRAAESFFEAEGGDIEEKLKEFEAV